QTTLINSEGIEWFPVDTLTIKTIYDDEKDAEFYIRPHNGPAKIDVFPETFVALFPNDAHMPKLVVNNSPSLVKKVVVKINKSLLQYI
ncbi:MAG: YhcH/YjgK/YiaL family protein, partial [bacterium]